LIRQTISQISSLGFSARVTRIREKYGFLRIDVVSGRCPRSDTMAVERALDAVVLLAEERSSLICEICGRPGAEAVTARGWLQTRCDEHLQTENGERLRRTESRVSK
jgi:hypothetical protein